jgi:hypothetical protein
MRRTRFSPHAATPYRGHVILINNNNLKIKMIFSPLDGCFIFFSGLVTAVGAPFFFIDLINALASPLREEISIAEGKTNRQFFLAFFGLICNAGFQAHLGGFVGEPFSKSGFIYAYVVSGVRDCLFPANYFQRSPGMASVGRLPSVSAYCERKVKRQNQEPHFVPTRSF